MSDSDVMEPTPPDSPADAEEASKPKKRGKAAGEDGGSGAAPLVLQVHVKALRAAVKVLDKVVESRNTIPILANVMIDAQDGRMAVTATDLDVEAIAHLDCTVTKRVVTTVPARQLRDILAKLDPDATLTLTVDSGKVVATAGRAKFTVPTLPAKDMPTIAVADWMHEFEVAPFNLGAMIDAVSVAMSNDETRYYLNGIYLHAATRAAAENPGGEALMVLRAAATDGHRLARFDIDQPDGSGALEGVIIPRKTVGILAALLDGEEQPVGVAISERMIRFDLDHTVLTSKLIDGTFPDYTRVIPTGNDKVLRVDRGSLADAVDRVMILGEGKAKVVKVELSRDLLRVSAQSPEGQAVEEVPADYDDGDMAIGFNGTYLLGTLQHVQGDTAEVRLADGAAPALVIDANPEARRLYVVMPMRV